MQSRSIRRYGLFGALQIGPGIKTAALGKSGFVGVK